MVSRLRRCHAAVQTVHENESIYIPIGAVHRLENPGKIQLELIEVQTGSYLGEDDVARPAAV
jgi:mannose-1-phosphate guanylyltransferase/mannose-6-phosphate isomerase